MRVKRNIEAKKLPYKLLKKIADEIYEQDPDRDKIKIIDFHLSVKKNKEEFNILLFNHNDILLDQYTYEVDILDKSITSVQYYPISHMLEPEEFDFLIQEIDKIQQNIERKIRRKEDKTKEYSIFDM